MSGLTSRHDAISPWWELSRRLSVATWRAVNASLDTVFYDVGALTSAERLALSTYAGPEGAVLIVFPRDAAHPIRTLTPVTFVDEQLGDTAPPVRAVAVAGVGSSAIGTAALARNVADYLGAPVAGIVSGFGLADAVAEALGGWLVLEPRNALREMTARLLDAYELKDHVRDPESHRDLKARLVADVPEHNRFLYGSPDSTTLLHLLLRLGGRLRLLVGHSKGSYSIENALEGWIDAWRSAPVPAPRELRVVTLGAVAWFPPDVADLHQFLGGIDYFGMLNSRIFVRRIDVPGAWHSLNTAVPGHVSVADALRSVDTFTADRAHAPGISR